MVHAKKEDRVVEIRRDPSRAELRWFGLTLAVTLGVLGVVVWGKGRFILGTGHAPPIASWVVWGIGVVVPAVYYAVPRARKRIFVGFMYLVYPIGLVMSHIILGVVFYLVITPIGVVMRLFGHDPMGRGFDPGASTYWTEHRTGADPARYFRQF